MRREADPNMKTLGNLSVDAFKPLLRERYFKLGLILLLPIVLFGIIGPLVLPRSLVEMGALSRNLPPSPTTLLGTDSYGRDIFVILSYSIVPSLTIGLIAGGLGNIIGFTMGLVGGYKGGRLGDVIGSITNVFMVVPTWPILVCLAAYVRYVDLALLALLIACFSWSFPARNVRSQVLSLKERDFVNLAKVNNQSDLSIMFKEIIPNIASFLVVSIIAGIGWAIQYEVGLEIIGLGPPGQQSLGWMVYWIMISGALYKGMWWWIGPPVAILILIFLGLQFMNMGLDVVFNPRLRTRG